MKSYECGKETKTTARETHVDEVHKDRVQVGEVGAGLYKEAQLLLKVAAKADLKHTQSPSSAEWSVADTAAVPLL